MTLATSCGLVGAAAAVPFPAEAGLNLTGLVAGVVAPGEAAGVVFLVAGVDMIGLSGRGYLDNIDIVDELKY